jgi:hypothetical protein
VKYLDYEDWQKSGENRIGVHSVYLRAPLGETTDVEASFVSDMVSGASPFFYDTLTGASRIGIRDRRQAADAKFTRSFELFRHKRTTIFTVQQRLDIRTFR